MERAMNKYDREIEELNNPKPMRFIGDEIIKFFGHVAVGAALGAIGYLALLGLDRVMVWLGV
jgi:hypothetical protein